VLAGKGGAGGDQLGRGALENHPPAVLTGAGAHVDEPIGVPHDRLGVTQPNSRTSGPHRGAVGWVDAVRGTAGLAVAIRTFWVEGDELRFGTGAGITWGSDAAREWEETELKAARLLSVASGRADPPVMAG